MIKLNNINYKFDQNRVPYVNGVFYGRKTFLYETEVIFSRARQEGFTMPSIAIKLAMDNHIRELINNNIWNKMDFYANFAYIGTTFESFALINWKNPYGSLLNTVGGTSYTTSGFKGNGVDAYVNTNFNLATPNINYTLNAATRGVVVYEASTNTSLAISVLDGNADNAANNMFNRNANAHKINNTATTPLTGDLTGTGAKVIVRLDATNINLISKDVVTSTTTPSTSIVSNPQRVLSRAANFGNAGVSSYWVSGKLTNSEVQIIRTSYNNYLTSIGLTAYA